MVGNEVKYIKKVLDDNSFNNVSIFDKESDTYDFLDKFLEEDDIILIKGSHGINLINVVNFLRKWKLFTFFVEKNWIFYYNN